MDYEIQRTSPTTYLDQTGAAINGFKVTVFLTEFDETHFLNVPNIDPATVKAAADKLLANRKALASLGQAESK